MPGFIRSPGDARARFGAPAAPSVSGPGEYHQQRVLLRVNFLALSYLGKSPCLQRLPVSIRVGLNSGEVVVWSIGSDLHTDYIAVGQTTHLAARMEQASLPGSNLISAETLRLAEGYIPVRPLGQVDVKEIGEPIEVYEVTGAGPVRTRLQVAAARGLTRFVGRDAEITQLHRALEKASQGHSQVAAVVGEPGVGTSRLFYEFARSHRTQAWLVVESGSVSYGKATAYLPVIELMVMRCSYTCSDAASVESR